MYLLDYCFEAGRPAVEDGAVVVDIADVVADCCYVASTVDYLDGTTSLELYPHWVESLIDRFFLDLT